MLFAALSLLLLLTACAPASPLPKTLSSAPPQWTPIAPPPTPPVVSDFVEGLNDMPPGKYLFVEYWADCRGISTSGECPGAAMIDFPTYSYSEGSLEGMDLDLSRGMADMASPPVGFFGYGRSHSGAMGGGADSELHVIDELPYTMLAHGRYEIGVLHSVDAQGNVFAEIDGTTYLLEPGHKWTQVSEEDTSPTCHLVTTSRLIPIAWSKAVFSSSP